MGAGVQRGLLRPRQLRRRRRRYRSVRHRTGRGRRAEKRDIRPDIPERRRNRRARAGRAAEAQRSGGRLCDRADGQGVTVLTRDLGQTDVAAGAGIVPRGHAGAGLQPVRRRSDDLRRCDTSEDCVAARRRYGARPHQRARHRRRRCKAQETRAWRIPHRRAPGARRAHGGQRRGAGFQHLQPRNCEVQVGRRFLRSLHRHQFYPDGKRERRRNEAARNHASGGLDARRRPRGAHEDVQGQPRHRGEARALLRRHESHGSENAGGDGPLHEGEPASEAAVTVDDHWRLNISGRALGPCAPPDADRGSAVLQGRGRAASRCVHPHAAMGERQVGLRLRPRRGAPA